MSKVPDERHPNSPLVEVVFEVRFPGETVIESRRHEIQEIVRAEFPNLLVPRVEAGMAVSLEPFRFEKQDGSAGVMVSINRFGYYCRAYPGFDRFSAECLRVMDLLGSIVPIRRLNRIGLRHINIIPFLREDDLVPFSYFFELGDKMLESLPGGIENISMAFALSGGGGKITTRIESITRTDGSQEAFLLDFDYAKEGELTFGQVRDYLKEAHDRSADLFHRLITPNYRDYIKGEEI
ncbi:MAG: TIGR04255 family protein [Desulfomonilaceae bacterium]|nr:TIGR04255 family protein [Desulfomonilaceae bacterium]